MRKAVYVRQSSLWAMSERWLLCDGYFLGWLRPLWRAHVAECTSRHACMHWRACRPYWSVGCLAAEGSVLRVVAGSCLQTTVYSGLHLGTSMQVVGRTVHLSNLSVLASSPEVQDS